MNTSKQIEIWRDILSHYDDNPERQEELFRELIQELREHLLPR